MRLDPFKRVKKSKIEKMKNYIKSLGKDKKKLLNLFVQFIFVVVNVYMGYKKVEHIQDSLRDIRKSMPKNFPKRTITEKLKDSAFFLLKNKKIGILAVSLDIQFFIHDIISFYDVLSIKNDTTQTKIMKSTIDDSIVSYITSLVIRQILDHVKSRKATPTGNRGSPSSV